MKQWVMGGAETCVSQNLLPWQPNGYYLKSEENRWQKKPERAISSSDSMKHLAFISLGDSLGDEIEGTVRRKVSLPHEAPMSSHHW